MATWLRHVKLQFGGTIGSPAVEEWSNTVRFSMQSEGDDPERPSFILTSGELEDALDALITPLREWFAGGSTRISNQCALTFAKLNMINEQGKQFDANTHRRDIALVTGGSAGVTPHWYETVALTMRTSVARGRANSGRTFPPLIDAPPQGGSPYIADAVAVGMAGAWATALNGISAAINSSAIAPNTDVYPVIASPVTTTGPNPGPALLRRVTGVVVDRVGDVQHRRTNRIPRLECARVPVTGA